MDFKEFASFWKGRIERDLTPFADPGTPPSVETASLRSLSASWVSRGEQEEAQFSLSLEEGVRVRYKGRQLPYKSFLADSGMADLLGLAKMIQQSRKRPGVFIDTLARLRGGDPAQKEPALAALRGLLEGAEADQTRVLMVTGDAGSGKTRVLQELVSQQAARYLSGKTDRLYLYVNAQGRALARFNEALATELQDLRARLTYHAVSAVVRAGILVPVIDGFDELLGMGGYDDAFSSLAGFIEELEGGGQLVASARSAYYEQEFVKRTEKTSILQGAPWIQTAVEVEPWGEREFSQYVRGIAEERGLAPGKQDELEREANEAFSERNAHLRQKPLFVAKAVELLMDRVEFARGIDLLSALVKAYLERERREKLLDRAGGSLLSETELESLLTNLAEEMWNQETRELDSRSVREVAEYVLLDSSATDEAKQIVASRMPTLAFLSPGSRTAWVSFEHELFFSYFLSLALERKLLSDGSGSRAFLGRSILPEAAVTTMLRRVNLGNEEYRSWAQTLFGKIEKPAGEEGMRAPQVRENAGVIAREAIRSAAERKANLNGSVLRNVVSPGGALGSVVLEGWSFERVEFRRVDLRGTAFVACRVTETLFSEPLIDRKSTKLGLTGLDPRVSIRGLRVVIGGEAMPVFTPEEILALLRECGAPIGLEAEDVSYRRNVSVSVVRLLEKLAMVYSSRNPVCLVDDNLKRLFGAPEWARIEKLLIGEGLANREHRPTGGAPKDFLRKHFLPGEFMSGLDSRAIVPPAVRRFWELVETEFPGDRVGRR
jgi:hypothetical protein